MKNSNKFCFAIILTICFLFVASALYAKPSGKVVLATRSEPDSLDPEVSSGGVGIWHNHALSDSLLIRDQETLEICPLLATSIKNIDPKTWELTLKKGVKFHNGEPFNAESVKFTFERILDPKLRSPIIKQADWAKAIQIVDPYKIRIITHKPYPLIYEKLQNFPMVPPKYIREKGDEYFGNHPIGTGPYKVVKWLRGQYIEYEANEDYWRGAPSVKTIIFKSVPDASTRVSELLSGSSDIIFDLGPDQVPAIEKSKCCNVSSAPSLRVAYIAFDAAGRGGKNPFMDKRVRQAINYGVDVDSLIKYTMRGRAVRAATGINSMVFGCDPSVKPYPYDPAKAKKLLAEAGYPNGFECTFYGYGGRFVNARQVMQAVMGYLEKLNIKTKPKWYETWPTYGQLIRGWKASQMHMGTWGSYRVFDASGVYEYLMHKDGVQAYYYTPETDKLIEGAKSTLDREKRRKIYYKLQRIIKEDAPWLFLWGQVELVGVNKRIEYQVSKDEIVRFYRFKIKK
jgi:peptide/nickel transport system substrate-binding protein